MELSEELIEAIQEVAKETNRDFGQVIRCALRNYIASRQPLETENK